MPPRAEPVDTLKISAQLGVGYERYDAAARERHAELQRHLMGAGDVAVEALPDGGASWTVTVCAADHVGSLSVVAGLFAAHHVDVVDCDVFTLRWKGPPPPAMSPRGRVARGGRRPPPDRQDAALARTFLDIFRVRAPAGSGLALWERFQADLGELFALLAAGEREAAHERLIDRVSASAHAAGTDAQLYPVTVELDNDRSAEATVLSIRAADTPGFLFEFTNALATLDVNIERAEVRTVAGEATDTFWITDRRGRKLSDARSLDELRVAAVLIKHFTHLLPHSPRPAHALRQFGSFICRMLGRPDRAADLRELYSARVLRTLAEMMGVSQFLWEDFLRMQHANLFPVLADAPLLENATSRQHMAEELRAEIAAAAGQAEALRRLNAFKDREMFRIDLRHITGRTGFLDFSRELAGLAEVIVEETAAITHRALEARYGPPMLAAGGRCGWSICALGKFGGRELGFASDIELLFIYEGDGTTAGPEPVPNAHYFDAFVRAFRDAIVVRREGIFELDLRLRPYGNQGALACSMGAFSGYYSDHGAAQAFERMAMVRLRPVAGDEALSEQIIAARDEWVYSGRPFDVANSRHLRQRQAAELVPSGAVNAKYSPGGVTDLEYFVQALQIEIGAFDPSVRVPGTLEAVERLSRGGHLPEHMAAKIQEAYGFMRRLIDALRVVRGNAKDLTIPQIGSPAFAYLARRLSFETPRDLAEALEVRMAFARWLWEERGLLQGD